MIHFATQRFASSLPPRRTQSRGSVPGLCRECITLAPALRARRSAGDPASGRVIPVIARRDAVLGGVLVRQFSWS